MLPLLSTLAHFRTSGSLTAALTRSGHSAYEAYCTSTVAPPPLPKHVKYGSTYVHTYKCTDTHPCPCTRYVVRSALSLIRYLCSSLFHLELESPAVPSYRQVVSLAVWRPGRCLGDDRRLTRSRLSHSSPSETATFDLVRSFSLFRLFLSPFSLLPSLFSFLLSLFLAFLPSLSLDAPLRCRCRTGDGVLLMACAFSR